MIAEWAVASLAVAAIQQLWAVFRLKKGYAGAYDWRWHDGVNTALALAEGGVETMCSFPNHPP
jgi:hypothetical protein